MLQKAAPFSPATLSLPKSGILFWLPMIQSRVSWWQPRLSTSFVLSQTQTSEVSPVLESLSHHWHDQTQILHTAFKSYSFSCHECRLTPWWALLILPLQVLYLLLKNVLFSHWSSSSGVSSSWKHLNFPVWVTSLFRILGSLPACNTLQADPFNTTPACPLSLFFT